MTARRILVLEDDANLGFLLREHLEMHGYTAVLCTNGVEGLTAYRASAFDLCLVDVMMPKKDGFSFAREVRQQDQRIPIIFLTARSLKEDRIEGFTIGGDDYVTKPFSMEELLLRIQAVLRRTDGAAAPAAEEAQTFTLGAYTFDHSRQTLTMDPAAPRRLTTKEADLLRLLCLHMNRTLEREEALRQVWGSDSFFNGRSMDVFISRLRKYLREDPRVEIMNVHGRGFRLVVQEVPDLPSGRQ